VLTNGCEPEWQQKYYTNFFCLIANLHAVFKPVGLLLPQVSTILYFLAYICVDTQDHFLIIIIIFIVFCSTFSHISLSTTKNNTMAFRAVGKCKSQLLFAT